MQLPIREAYCPGHFGNSYEAMWPREMAAYLAEMRHWGFNRFGDWMTCTDVCNPYATDAYWNLPLEMYSRKKAAFRAAQELGMANDLILTPNHVFLDQLRPDLLATKGPNIFGQLLCPSKQRPGRFAGECRPSAVTRRERGSMDLHAFAYDYGGCVCDCAPWILTTCGWCATSTPWRSATTRDRAVAVRLVVDRGARPARRLPREALDDEGDHLHIPYGRTRFADVPVPDGAAGLPSSISAMATLRAM